MSFTVGLLPSLHKSSADSKAHLIRLCSTPDQLPGDGSPHCSSECMSMYISLCEKGLCPQSGCCVFLVKESPFNVL